ncbi:MAG TPA: non-homologous end-joining DNA ligase [Candidatus Methylomirabilis sp.]|nr:non-homologous end-joining DNA ligase [Candidatus Methylomirabilis sp.]
MTGSPKVRDSTVAGVTLTHPDRILYPPQGTTKRDLALFYESIAEWIVPHLKGRPISLVRCPEGVGGACFYQKHVGVWGPSGARRVKIKEKSKVGEYLVVDDLAALVGLVQMGVLEIHTWNAVVADIERPNRLVFDLDPDPALPWARVAEAARLVRDRLSSAGLRSWVKTTGGKGLHVVVPLAPGPTWAESGEFARAVAEAMAQEEPRRYTAQMARSSRGGKIFIDYLRNVRGATSVAAFSTRATPQAPVSVPVDWEELSTDLRGDHFTLARVRTRLARLRADPWKGYWTTRQSLPSPHGESRAPGRGTRERRRTSRSN